MPLPRISLLIASFFFSAEIKVISCDDFSQSPCERGALIETQWNSQRSRAASHAQCTRNRAAESNKPHSALLLGLRDWGITMCDVQNGFQVKSSAAA